MATNKPQKETAPNLTWMSEDTSEDEIEQQDNWQFMTEALTDYMDKLNKHNKHQGYWRADVNNFGWRSQDGYKNFKADTGMELLTAILPKTDCYFKIFIDYRHRTIKIQNFHHDSPMGKEWYTIRPMTAKEAEQFIYKDC